jgi:hypothetical protein
MLSCDRPRLRNRVNLLLVTSPSLYQSRPPFRLRWCAAGLMSSLARGRRCRASPECTPTGRPGLAGLGKCADRIWASRPPSSRRPPARKRPATRDAGRDRGHVTQGRGPHFASPVRVDLCRKVFPDLIYIVNSARQRRKGSRRPRRRSQPVARTFRFDGRVLLILDAGVRTGKVSGGHDVRVGAGPAACVEGVDPGEVACWQGEVKDAEALDQPLVSGSWRMISLFAKSFAKMSEIRHLS